MLAFEFHPIYFLITTSCSLMSLHLGSHVILLPALDSEVGIEHMFTLGSFIVRQIWLCLC